MHYHLFQKTYHSILCLDGDLPKLSFFQAHQVPLIAADGAANTLNKMGLAPDMVIGDLDSLAPTLKKTLPTRQIPCQESSDFQKSLVYLEQHNLLPTLVVGMNGGCLDHILNNINLFMDTNSAFYAPPIKGAILKRGEHVNLALPINSKISIFGMPCARISSKALKWELNEFELKFPGQTSCFNQTLASKVALKVHEGTVLVMAYETNDN